MIVGRMFDLIRIEKLTSTKDEYGAEKNTWGEYLTCKAEKIKTTGRKSVDNDEIFNTYTKVFNIWYRKGISEDMRVIYNDDKYKIESIDEDKFNNVTQLTISLINE